MARPSKQPLTPAQENKIAALGGVAAAVEPEQKAEVKPIVSFEEEIIVLCRSLCAYKDDQIRRIGIINEIENLLAKNGVLVG